MNTELTTVQSIKTALTAFFTNDIYTITDDAGYIIITSNLTQLLCGQLIFTVESKHIYLGYLSKCDTSGTQFLDYLELFARKYNYNITLMDASTITEYNIDLSRLKILINGESWYNSKGYKSDDYENEIKLNLLFINKPVKDLIEILRKGVIADKEKELDQNSIESLTNRNSVYSKHPANKKLQERIAQNLEKIENNEQILRDIEQKYEQIMNETLTIFETIVVKSEDMTIQQFFIEINKQLQQQGLDVNYMMWLARVVNNYTRPYIRYNTNLTNRINKTSGGKCRKKCTIRKKRTIRKKCTICKKRTIRKKHTIRKCSC